MTLLMRALHTPLCEVIDAVATLEREFDIGMPGVATHQMSHVVYLILLSPLGTLRILQRALHIVAFHTRGSAIQRQADGIQDGRLTRPRLAGDKKYIRLAQWGSVEVDHSILDRCYVVYLECFEFHDYVLVLFLVGRFALRSVAFMARILLHLKECLAEEGMEFVVKIPPLVVGILLRYREGGHLAELIDGDAVR